MARMEALRFGADLARALGLDPDNCLHLSLDVKPDELLLVKADLVVTKEQAAEVLRIVREYDLVARERP